MPTKTHRSLYYLFLMSPKHWGVIFHRKLSQNFPKSSILFNTCSILQIKNHVMKNFCLWNECFSSCWEFWNSEKCWPFKPYWIVVWLWILLQGLLLVCLTG
jgi:hypothetical protein